MFSVTVRGLSARIHIEPVTAVPLAAFVPVFWKMRSEDIVPEKTAAAAVSVPSGAVTLLSVTATLFVDQLALLNSCDLTSKLYPNSVSVPSLFV
jgi:hypothetical protein